MSALKSPLLKLLALKSPPLKTSVLKSVQAVMMFQLYSKIKWMYQKFKVSMWLPSLALVSYTVIGAMLFQFFEREPDERRRENYRNQTSYALEQVLGRMLEVRCHDQLVKSDKELQVAHAKEALFWFMDYLNLTEVITERTVETPWTWLGSMFYAGQLYTTIGYGYPITRTTGGRVASIFYILFGIPIFLIILKDMGRLLSRGFRKLYKRLRYSKQKIEEKTLYTNFLFWSLFGRASVTDEENKQKKKLEEERKDIDPEKQNQINQRIRQVNDFPIPIALCILAIWILLSASLFCLWEREWGFMTSVYFFFVSISTVGLGDIVFDNPDMMIFYFGLILVGLALLSMCFNLIQTAIERLLDRMLEEYIEEIEKMAEIVANDEYLEEETMPLEFKMSGNLLTLPMKRVTAETGFLAEAKSWMAGRIANNLLASRLGGREDEDSSDEEEKVEKEKQRKDSISSKRSSVHGTGGSRRSSSHAVSAVQANSAKHSVLHNRPIFNTLKTLEKIKPQSGDFRAMVFSKFIQSDRLTRLVEETAVPQVKMATVACQTDWDNDNEPVVKRSSRKWRYARKDSVSSFSTVYTNSALFDDESIISNAYCDLKFDYSDMSSPCPLRSELSISKATDMDILPLSPGKLNQIWAPIKSQLRVGVPQLTAVYEQPSPIYTAEIRKCPSSDNITSIMSPDPMSPMAGQSPTRNSDQFDHIRSICGLLPLDFDTKSTSSRSTMVDSGYGDRDGGRKLHRPDSMITYSIMEESDIV